MTDYFKVDHDRENNPNKSQVIEQIMDEIAEIKEYLLQKQVMEELTTIPYSKKLNRLEDLAYFVGRYDGEYFAKKQEEF